MMQLTGKNVLVIMPLFFGYEQEIQNCLKTHGASVHMIYENINDIYLGYKAIYAYIKPMQKAATYHYYKKHLSKIKQNFDYVLVIRGFSMSEEVMQLIRERSAKDCRYILYLWDSVKNNPNPVKIAHLFDSVYTFDHKDANEYGWVYHPTFFIDAMANPHKEKDIDIAFVCSMHSQRYQVLQSLKTFSQIKDLNLYTHVYLNRVIFFKYKYLDRKPLFVNMKKNDLQHYMLSLKDTYALYQRSKIIVDFTNPAQTGFTQRTFEAIGNGCKLITSNPLVKELDFYNEKNILVYDGATIQIPDWFVRDPYLVPDSNIYQKYSLTEWIKDILS